MATDPIFASIVSTGAQLLGAVETSLTVPTTTSIIITAGASGTKVEEIVVHAATTSLTPTTVAGLVYVFLYDGTTYHLYDTIVVTAVTASSSVTPYRTRTVYSTLILKTGWSLRCSQSNSSNANLLKVTAVGGDF